MRIEDYAVIGNCETIALVGANGSIDWLCWPRFESPACFAALLGDAGNGRWLIAPCAAQATSSRRYQGDTLVLETTFVTAEGEVDLIDCMRRGDGRSDLIRLVRGRRGRVRMHSELVVRFDYGNAVPWVSRLDDGRRAYVAGPQRLVLASEAEPVGRDLSTVSEFDVVAGQEVAFTLTWSVSYRDLPPPFDARAASASVADNWREWSRQFHADGPWPDAVMRSLLTLKALTHHETGGIVAAGTTSLPERLGGARNWDYRYCWLRDSTFTLYALMDAGFTDEARRWRDWLVRAVAGSPEQVQTLYDVLGRRHVLAESTLPWLAGYEGARPVRIGNAAHTQFQLDVYGEVIDSLFMARSKGLAPLDAAWDIERALIERIVQVHDEADAGIWEVRGPPRHFTHSKVMAWVGLDRAVRSVTEHGLSGDAARWAALRDALHAQICERAFCADKNSFVQSYGSRELDASLLLLPLVGFLPARDPRVLGTVAAIERELLVDGLVRRYRNESNVDGLGGGNEGVFLACSFWLVDNYTLLGRRDEAWRLCERLLALRNDVGLLSEQYDPAARRLLGNFPQAFSHVAIINSARKLAPSRSPARQRSEDAQPTRAGDDSQADAERRRSHGEHAGNERRAS